MIDIFQNDEYFLYIISYMFKAVPLSNLFKYNFFQPILKYSLKNFFLSPLYHKVCCFK